MSPALTERLEVNMKIKTINTDVYCETADEIVTWETLQKEIPVAMGEGDWISVSMICSHYKNKGCPFYGRSKACKTLIEQVKCSLG